MKPAKRVFRRATPLIGNTGLRSTVDRWEWTRSHGLRVFFRHFNPIKPYKSDYTLPELLARSKPEGDLIESTT